MRDRFVHGLKNRAIQKKLLTEKDLTWKLAVDIAHAMESADKQANTLPSEGNSSTQEIRSNDRDPVRYVDNEKESTDFGGLFHVHESNPEPSIVIPVKINGKVSMELDLQCQLCQRKERKVLPIQASTFQHATQDLQRRKPECHWPTTSQRRVQRSKIQTTDPDCGRQRTDAAIG